MQPGRSAQLTGGIILLLCLAACAASAAQNEISGMVRAEDGAPITSARVGVIDRATGKMLVAESDAAGRFVIPVPAVSVDHRYRVVVTRFGYSTATLDTVAPGGKPLEVTLVRAKGRPDMPQGGPAATGASPDATYKVAVGLVTLNVTVCNPAGAPVRGLKKADFSIFEEGQPKEIVQFGEENTPASVVLLLDTSSSMEGTQLAQAKRAALEFIERSGAGDEIALVGFNDKIEVLQGPTRDRLPLRSAVGKLSALGGTALYDAIARGIEVLKSARHPRHVMLILSDGIDADSRRKFHDVQRLVQASDVLVYAIGEYVGPERERFMTANQYYKLPALEENYNPVWVLRELADVSGGKASFPETNAPLEPFFAEIARELADQYVLAYVPQPPAPQPEFRRIEVRLSAPGSDTYSVRTRKGYLSPGTEQLSRKN